MANELWTSPITGYRRRGTRLSELRALLSSGITAHAILEPLQSCPAYASAEEMKNLLSRRDFDVAGVKSHSKGPVVGFVERPSLDTGTVSDHLQPITTDRLISEATPLPRVLTVLKAQRYVFVLIGSDIGGIVTRADLNKPPVRVYLFGIISLLEMHLDYWVKDKYDDTTWQQKLKPERLQGAKDVYNKRKRQNQQVDLFDCLQLCDKTELVITQDDLRNKLGFQSKTKAREYLGRAEKLRNNLAHSQQDLAKGSTWEKMIELVEWVEDHVNASDQLVEKEVTSKLTEQGDSGLWASA